MLPCFSYYTLTCMKKQIMLDISNPKFQLPCRTFDYYSCLETLTVLRNLLYPHHVILDVTKQVVNAMLKLESVFVAKISPDPTQYTIQQLTLFQQIIVIHTALTLLLGKCKILFTISCFVHLCYQVILYYILRTYFILFNLFHFKETDLLKCILQITSTKSHKY